MKTTKVRLLLATAAALALMVGVGTAFAASGNGGGNDLKQAAAHVSGRASFEAQVAKNLDTTAAKLRAAIKTSARAHVDSALAADEITADEATTLKDALAAGEIPAIRLATAAGVASELDTTVAKLDTAWSSAAKTQATAHVDKALKDGKITEAQATTMKAQIAKATFPGFGAMGPGGPGGHGGHGGPGGPGGHGGPGGPGGPDGGMGFGPPPTGEPQTEGTTTTALPAFAAA